MPLPVLGVVNGVREAFHGLCIATGLQVLEALMEERDHPGTAGSIREGLDETLTLQRLGLTGALQRYAALDEHSSRT